MGDFPRGDFGTAGADGSRNPDGGWPEPAGHWQRRFCTVAADSGRTGVCLDRPGRPQPHFEAGNWEQEGTDQRLLDEAAALHGLAASRYGQYRLSRTRPDSATEPDTCPLHVELRVPTGTTVEAPFAGVVHQPLQGVLQLDGPQLSVRLWGVTPSPACRCGAGQRPGAGRGQWSADRAVVPRLFVQCTVVLQPVASGGLASVVPVTGRVAGAGL